MLTAITKTMDKVTQFCFVIPWSFPGLFTRAIFTAIFFSLLLEHRVLAKELLMNESETDVYDCSSAKEFATAYRFLVSEKTVSLPKEDASKLALYISSGCTGAAARFVKVAHMLLKAGLSGRDAVSYAKLMSHKTDEQTNAFIEIFKSSFLEKGLDLDIMASVSLARRFSADYTGDSGQGMKDYYALTKFCVSKDELALPRVKCAEIARSFSLLGESSKISVVGYFKKAYKFLTRDKNGPQLATGDALKLMKEIMTISPKAIDNFVSSYRFSISKKGMNLGRDQAVILARKVAKHTFRKKQKNPK